MNSHHPRSWDQMRRNAHEYAITTGVNEMSQGASDDDLARRGYTQAQITEIRARFDEREAG